jgi:DHA1 family tetracycline resistance protein-like MFS transporter
LPEPAPANDGRRKAAMSFIMITVLIDMIAVGLIVPVLPHIVGNFTTSNEEQTFWFGAVAFSFGIANFLGSPILGALSDRHGRRPVLLLGFIGLALSFIVTGLATALWMLIVVRLFSGAMQANMAIANAYVADITPPEERTRRFGLLGAMFGIGFTLGPVIGGLLGAIDVRLPFFVAGGVAVLNWLWGWYVLPESLPPERRRAFEWKRAHPFAALAGLARLRGVGPLVLVVALTTLAQFVLHTSWVLYTHFKFGWGPKEVGWSLFAVGAMTALAQGVLLRFMVQRTTPQRLAMLALVAGTLSYLGFGAATEGWMMYVVIVIGNILGAGGVAAIQSLVSGAADPHNQGETMGSLGSLNSLMSVVAPVLGSVLLGVVSGRPQGDWLIGLPYYFCSALVLTATLIAAAHFRRHAKAAALPA